MEISIREGREPKEGSHIASSDHKQCLKELYREQDKIPFLIEVTKRSRPKIFNQRLLH